MKEGQTCVIMKMHLIGMKEINWGGLKLILKLMIQIKESKDR